jgi:release factor glutamine methyltransferase
MASLLLQKNDQEGQATLPSLDHLTMEDYENVYEPSEDTFLLCDALEKDRLVFKDLLPRRALEIGPGSGCVITFFGQLCKEIDVSCSLYAADINNKAVEVTRRTAEANGINVTVSNVDLLGENAPADNSVDVLLFNPPYVPTPSNEVGSDGIEAAWAGGMYGREVIDRFLPALPNMLSRPHGRCYLVLVKENKPTDISQILQAHGFETSITVAKKARNEQLMVMLVTWAEPTEAPPLPSSSCEEDAASAGYTSLD